mgnify:FL=1|jgi:uncharacterized membrane protein YhaH (DUF805 family)
MKYYLDVIKKYVKFDGRARRKEYWMFVLFNAIFGIVASLLDNLLGLNFSSEYSSYASVSTGIIASVYSLAVFLPTLAVGVRRLHDIGKSGWWLLICLVPLAGPIWLLVLMVTDGVVGENQYGSDPKAA